MKGVFIGRKYIMQRVDEEPIPRRDGEENLVLSIEYKAIDGNGRYTLSLSEYEMQGRPKKIELDTSKTDRRTGFKVRKLE